MRVRSFKALISSPECVSRYIFQSLRTQIPSPTLTHAWSSDVIGSTGTPSGERTWDGPPITIYNGKIEKIGNIRRQGEKEGRERERERERDLCLLTTNHWFISSYNFMVDVWQHTLFSKILRKAILKSRGEVHLKTKSISKAFKWYIETGPKLWNHNTLPYVYSSGKTYKYKNICTTSSIPSQVEND